MDDPQDQTTNPMPQGDDTNSNTGGNGQDNGDQSVNTPTPEVPGEPAGEVTPPPAPMEEQPGMAPTSSEENENSGGNTGEPAA